MKVVFISVFTQYERTDGLYEIGNDDYFRFGMGYFIAKEFQRNQYDIEFECWRTDCRIRNELSKKIDGILYRIFPSKKIKYLGEFSFSIIKELRKYGTQEKIVFHFMGAHLVNYHIMSFFAKPAKLISTHLGGANPLWNYKANNKLFSLIYYYLEKYILLKHYKCFISICIPEIEYFKSIKVPAVHMPLFGISNEKVFIIKNKEECRKKLKIPENKKVILQVGRAVKERGFDWIFKIIDNNLLDDSYLWYFIGVDRFNECYNGLISRKQNIVGTQTHEQLSDWYNAVDTLVYLPNTKMDLNFAGTSYVPLEALICGTPVVASTLHHFPSNDIYKIAKVPENFDDVVPMIKDVITKPPQRELCREIVLNYFSWQDSLSEHYKLYSS